MFSLGDSAASTALGSGPSFFVSCVPFPPQTAPSLPITTVQPSNGNTCAEAANYATSINSRVPRTDSSLKEPPGPTPTTNVGCTQRFCRGQQRVVYQAKGGVDDETYKKIKGIVKREYEQEGNDAETRKSTVPRLIDTLLSAYGQIGEDRFQWVLHLPKKIRTDVTETWGDLSSLRLHWHNSGTYLWTSLYIGTAGNILRLLFKFCRCGKLLRLVLRTVRDYVRRVVAPGVSGSEEIEMDEWTDVDEEGSDEDGGLTGGW